MRVAAAQYCASNDILQNQDTIARLISQASSQSVSLICFPECANIIAKNKKELQEKAEPADNSDTLKRIKTLAQKYNIIISLGSLLLRQSDSKKILNRSFLVDINGECIATYDKIHMFDASVGDGKIYRESEDFQAGEKIITRKTSIAHIGLSICYDVRFPQMYRKMAQAGAEIMVTPAAFTAKTGKAHWHVLQRARAIETGSFIIAAAQSGTHADGRQTYGHALIVNPWGEIIAEAPTPEAELVLADIDLNEVDIARNAIGAWKTE